MAGQSRIHAGRGRSEDVLIRMDSEVTYDDMSGLHIPPHQKWFMWATGHRPNAVGPVSKGLALRRLFGLLVCAFTMGTLIAAINGVLPGNNTQGLIAVAQNLVVFAICLSSLHKYEIFITQEYGITRITKWMKKTKKINESKGLLPTPTELFVHRQMKFFYFGGLITPWLMTGINMLQGRRFTIEYPYIDQEENRNLYIPIVILSYWVLSMEGVFNATCLINMLFTFRTELKHVTSDLSEVRYNPDNKEQFGQSLKEIISRQVELIDVFRDLKNLNDSMFGYQVFSTIFTTSAMIYGASKDATFIYMSTTQVLPVTVINLLEFALLCWLGEEIKFGLQEFHTNICMTDWYEAPLRDQNSMKIVLTFSKHPKILTGFTVMKATLETFVETMKQSFSLYTLMNALG